MEPLVVAVSVCVVLQEQIVDFAPFVLENPVQVTSFEVCCKAMVNT
jgi:hypothetical protein